MKSLTNKDMVIQLANLVKEHGGRTFFVGGYVRDALMGIENKDIDVEVHGIESNVLENILDQLGNRINIGKSFGIYALKGYSLDIAMPRKEKLKGVGHKDFDIFVDSNIGTYKAALRRDFTVNAIMQDVLTNEIVDHFNGQQDLKDKILRHVNSESFTEDPLRVLRAAQFASRFGFTIATETIALCRTMKLNSLSKERVEAELKKALLKSNKPSIFFRELVKMEQLQSWFEEVQALMDINQNPKYHAEGDVYTHTMMVLDAAVEYRDKVDNSYGFMLAALCHDFGKAVCTEEINGVIHSYEHEIKGLPLVKTFIQRITDENKIMDYALNLVKLHMRPNILARSNSAIKSTNKMFDKAIEPLALIYIALADGKGRILLQPEETNEKYLFERLNIYKEMMSEPYVTGQDLIDVGLKPDSYFKELLEYSHKLRLAGVNKEKALKQTISYAKKLIK